MSLVISPKIAVKLSQRHHVTQDEIEQCFENRTGKYLVDTREEHASDPPTLWFIGETDSGRKLKIAFVPEHGNVYLRTAFQPSLAQINVYTDAIGQDDQD